MTLRLTIENADDLPPTVATRIEFGARQRLTIGRSQTADWMLPDRNRLLSGTHCEIRYVDGDYLLHDLSANGTFIEGSPTRISSPYRLRDGDRLSIGSHCVRVEIGAVSRHTAAEEATRIVRRPDAEPRLQLSVLKAPDAGGPAVATANLGRQGMLRIGRHEGADWVLPDRSGGVSREHCSIRFADDAFFLDDTSANGTFINGASERPANPCRLQDGDQLLIGGYLVAVGITGRVDPPAAGDGRAEAENRSTKPAPATGDRSSPVRRTSKARRGGDPAALLAGSDADVVPNAEQEASDRPERATAALPVGDVTRLVPAGKRMAVTQEMSTNVAPARATEAAAAVVADETVLAAIARGLGLSPNDLHERDAAALGNHLAELIVLLSGELRELLALCDTVLDRPRTGRANATGSNPLAIMPTTEEALRVLFGPPRKAYLDRPQSFQASLHELHEQLRLMGSAIRGAARVLNHELSPEAVERSVSAEGRFGQLIGSRKARLWEVYVERWNSRPPIHPERPASSFCERFASDPGDGDHVENH